MRRTRDLLNNLASQDSDKTYTYIAKIILKDYDKGIFKSQKDLAVECFVSESLITKFAKSIGFTGWKELFYTLKNEYEKFNNIESGEDLSIEGFLFEEFKKFNNYINTQTDFLNQLSSMIFEKKKIILLPSYQNESSCELFYDLLVDFGIEVYLIKDRSLYSSIIKNKNLLDFPILLVISGRDNNSLINYYNSFKKEIKKQNVFVITSNSQNHKTPIFREKLILNPYAAYTKFKFRRLLLEYFFINVFLKIKDFK